MTALSTPAPERRLWAALRPDSRALWVLLAVVIAAILYLSTVQTIINGSGHPYVTDVGEHQNALPRWGTIHHSGYPQWSFLGSFFVSLLGVFGVEPAAAVSLYALAWGLLTVALLVIFAMELGAAGPWAAMGALAAAVSTSVWMDASIGELHTATMAVTVAILLFALRFGRSGAPRDLLWLVFLSSQGVFHQRSIIVLAPAILLLIWPHFVDIFRMGRRTWLAIIGLALLGPLAYLYLPLRVWAGADWVFGSPGTWDGFWTLFFDNRADRVFDTQTDWLARVQTTLDILAEDLFWPLLAAGLVGLWVPFVEALSQRRQAAEARADRRQSAVGGLRVSVALTAAWVPNFVLTVLIWRDRVTDGQLAAKLPVLLLAGVGLALLIDGLWRRSRVAGGLAAVAILGSLIAWGWQTRPFILSITRDDNSQAIVAAVDRVRPDDAARLTTVAVPWGTDYWTLTYAQGFEGKLQGLNLVDHNADPRAIIARGDRLLLPDQTLRIFPLSYYEDRLGPLYLSAAAPGVFEISPGPINDPLPLAADSAIYPAMLDLGNGIRIWGVKTSWAGPGNVLVDVYWERVGPVDADYSVAVHLVSQDPPASEADLLDQDDQAHPVGGWYPTSHWRAGELVRDQYLLTIPEGSEPAAIRLGMYRSDPEAGFVNTPWLSLPLPAP